MVRGNSTITTITTAVYVVRYAYALPLPLLLVASLPTQYSIAPIAIAMSKIYCPAISRTPH